MMAASEYDAIYEFRATSPSPPTLPKKPIRTYGKNPRPKFKPSSSYASALQRPARPSVPAPKPTATIATPTSSFDREPARPRIADAPTRKQAPSRPAKRAYSGATASNESQSQPLPEAPALIDSDDEESAKTKRRKLTRTYSEMHEKSPGPYSTPDPSPPRAQTPKRAVPAQKALVSNKASAPAGSKAPSRRVATEAKVFQRESAVASSSTTSAKAALRQAAPVERKAHQPLKQHSIPLRPASKKPTQKSPSKAVTSAPLKPEPALAPPSAPPRKRLIDALAAQAEEESSESSSEDDHDDCLPDSQGVSNGCTTPRRASPHAHAPAPSSQPRGLTRQTSSLAKKPGPKFTYGQQRSFLPDNPLSGGLGGLGGLGGTGTLSDLSAPMETSKLLRFGFADFGNPPPPAASWSLDDDDDELGNSGAVQSIHELRQAGSNSRFADEMLDVMDRIGTPSQKPSSSRRGGLLELADKMREKEFRRQFRNQSGDHDSLFTSLDKETDIIAGYVLACITVMLLASSASSHIIMQLRTQGVAVLLERLLHETSDMATMAKDKKHNVSKFHQRTLATVGTAIAKLPVWDSMPPSQLSPRTVALKCIHLIQSQTNDTMLEDDILGPKVTDILFSILSSATVDDKCWGPSSQPQSIDFGLVLILLEAYSGNVMLSQAGPRWMSRYLPAVADALVATLSKPSVLRGDLAKHMLGLCINLTNNSSDVAALFVGQGLLRELALAVCKAFRLLSSKDGQEDAQAKVLENLNFMLGIMINLCAYYPPAAQSLAETGTGNGDDESPAVQLIQVFLVNLRRTSDNKKRPNVAFGWLAVVLGYLCINDSIRDRFEAMYDRPTILPLLNAIQLIIKAHEATSTGEEYEDGMAQRLQTLVDRLEHPSS